MPPKSERLKQILLDTSGVYKLAITCFREEDRSGIEVEISILGGIPKDWQEAWVCAASVGEGQWHLTCRHEASDCYCHPLSRPPTIQDSYTIRVTAASMDLCCDAIILFLLFLGIPLRLPAPWSEKVDAVQQILILKDKTREKTA